MADNLTTQSATPATVPASSVIATDDVAGVHFQKVKIDVGGDGASAALSSTAPLPVGTTAIQDTGNSTSTPLGSSGNFTGTGFLMDGYASWSVNIYSDKASATNGLKIEWSDDNTNWDFADQTTYVASVGNMITFGRKAKYVRLNYTNTNSAQGTFRVTAYGQPISVRQTRKFIGAQLTDADTGQVVVAALQGHTTAGGSSWVDVKVDPSGALATSTVLSAGTANIGDVDVLSIAAGDNNIGNVDIVTVPAPLSTTGTGTEASALRVTIATDSTGVLSVDDNGASLTVDGTVTANLAAGTNNIGDVDVLSIAAGDNNIGNVDIVTMPNVTNGGTFAVQESGAALTALQLIDDVVYTDDTSTHATGTSKGALIMAAAAPTDTAVNANDIGAVGMTVNRGLYVSVQDALPAGTNGIGKLTANAGVTIGAVEIAATQTLSTVTTVGTVTTLTGGGIAHDSGDSGNPHKIGAKAETSPKGITLVADGDRTDLYADADGLLMVKLNTSLADIISERVTDTGGTSTAFTNFSAVASTRNYVTAITVYNSNASGGYVDFRDGTGGTVLWTMPIPAGGGSVIASSTPLFKTSANTALAYDVSGALSTVYISVSGFQSKAG
jgi:hypothetical protein